MTQIVKFCSHLKVLTMLSQSSISAEVIRYLLSHDGYGLLSKSVLGIRSKDSPQLPLLVPLLTVSFTIFPPPSPEYLQAIIGLFSNILTMSLLPNRMPIPSLIYFSSALPFTSCHFLNHIFPSFVQRTQSLKSILSPTFLHLPLLATKCYRRCSLLTYRF